MSSIYNNKAVNDFTFLAREQRIICFRLNKSSGLNDCREFGKDYITICWGKTLGFSPIARMLGGGDI